MTYKEPTSKTFIHKLIFCIFLGTVLLLPISSDAQIRKYEVVFNASAPELDGIRSPGEWDKASEAATDFQLLRTGGESTENIKFQLLLILLNFLSI